VAVVLKVRVIPTLLWRDYGLVKGVRFDSWRRVGPVLPAIKVYNARDVDEIVLVDIVATVQGNTPDPFSISDFADECSVPLTVGGGITRLDQIAALLQAGADKVSINTAAVCFPGIISSAANEFGSQCIVVSIDARRDDRGKFRCMTRCGTFDSGREVVEWAKEATARGAGEILLTSVDRDGTMQGYDLELIEAVAAAVDVPVIASGGAGSYAHCVDAVVVGGASAVAAATIFHFTELTPAGVKDALNASGVPVRRRHQVLSHSAQTKLRTISL
jgi:cyclase